MKQPENKLRVQLVIDREYFLKSKHNGIIKHVTFKESIICFATNKDFEIGYYIRHEFQDYKGTGIHTIPDNNFEYIVMSIEPVKEEMGT